MDSESSTNFDLCVVCKTSRMLCGKRNCPLLKKWSSEYSIERPKITNLDESFSPPSFFVGWSGYPSINAGPMLTVDRVSADVIDNSSNWTSRTQEEIVQMRIALLRTRSRIDVKRPLDSDIIQRSHELLLGKNSIDVEVELEKKIIPRITLNERSAPHGPIAPIKKLNIIENQSPIPVIEKAYYDTDLLATEAVDTLGKENVDINSIIRIFSAGMLGREKARKLVPTRWSITAVDDMLSKQKVELLKANQELGEFRIFTNTFFGNRFFIILIPDVWSYEMIETWFSGAYMNPSERDIGLGDWEPYSGRTEYASNVTGAYYAARLGVADYLLKINRQAQAIVLREITKEYRFPLGVWVIRVAVRGAMQKEYVTADSIDAAFDLIPQYLQYPIEYWKSRSRMFDFIKTQRKLDDFM